MYRIAFVLEQNLGHVTFAQNLRSTVELEPNVVPTWLPLDPHNTNQGFARALLKRNWTLQASTATRTALRSAGAPGKFDAILFHTQVTALFSVGLLRRTAGVISMDATPRNYDTLGAAYGHFQGSPLIERVKDFVNRRALRTAIHLTTWSEWARQSLINDYGIPGGNVTVIPPGTQLDLWEPRPRPGSPGSKVRLLFVGGDFVRKGGDLLLDVFRKRLAGACTLDMVSNASVQNLPAGVRLHHGLKANSAALRSLFAEADIFVLPTRADCLPLVLMEAMAASLPIVTTDVAALGEAVRHHDNGLLVRPNDGHALNSALETLVADAALRTRMGAAGRQIAEQRFDARANGRMLLDLLRRAADRRIAERSLPS